MSLIITPSEEQRLDLALPQEVWILVFMHATALPRFLDARWNSGTIVTAFEETRLAEGNVYDMFAHSFYTRKVIPLVCRDWRRYSYELLYQQIIIRRPSQLKKLVQILQHSQDYAHQFGRSVGLGWWITHVKILTMDYDVEVRSDNEFSDHEESNCAVSHVRRLLSFCPRLEVFIDAAPYGFDERPKDVLSYFMHPPTSSDTTVRSLEWVYGGPSFDDLLHNPHITNSLITLRCSSIHVHHPTFAPPSLSFTSLKYLDMFLSPQSHTHWRVIGERGYFPSLTHLTIRTPASSGTNLGADAIISLRQFLTTHGWKLLVLDLKVCPGDSQSSPHHHLGGEAIHTFSVPPILALCPNLIDLVISARWLASHTPLSTHTVSSPFTGQTLLKLRRIGLRDTSPLAEGFSASLAREGCTSCTRLPLSHILTSPGRGEFVGQEGADTFGVVPTMTHRHCTIDRHFRALLRGARVTSDAFQGASQLLPGNSAVLRQIAEASSTDRAFPRLATIQLLDSERDMLELEGNGMHCNAWRTCWCTPRETRNEIGFWSAWAIRCSQRGVTLLDREGDTISFGSEGVSDVSDLQQELEDSLMLFRRMTDSERGTEGAGVPTWLRLNLRLSNRCARISIFDQIFGWLSRKGILGDGCLYRNYGRETLYDGRDGTTPLECKMNYDGWESYEPIRLGL